MKRRTPLLSLAMPAVPLVAPVDRGALWYDFQIVDRFFGGLPTIGNKVRWIREHLPRGTRIKVGQTSAWYEQDIIDFLEAERGRVEYGASA